MSDDTVIDFRRGPSRRQDQAKTDGRNWSNTPEQREALTVGCRHCHAEKGSLCVTDDKRVLTRFPAHAVRTIDAARAKGDRNV